MPPVAFVRSALAAQSRCYAVSVCCAAQALRSHASPHLRAKLHTFAPGFPAQVGYGRIRSQMLPRFCSQHLGAAVHADARVGDESRPIGSAHTTKAAGPSPSFLGHPIDGNAHKVTARFRRHEAALGGSAADVDSGLPIPADAVGRRLCAVTECSRPLAYAATLCAGTCGEIRKILAPAFSGRNLPLSLLDGIVASKC